MRRLQREVEEDREEQRAGHPPGRVDPAFPGRRGGAFGLDRGPGELLVERGKEVVRHFPRDPVDQARADLGELAPDAGLGGVSQARARAFGLERNLRAVGPPASAACSWCALLVDFQRKCCTSDRYPPTSTTRPPAYPRPCPAPC